VGLGKYIKKAFLYHWNLLAFLGGMGFALLSGHPDVAVPLVLAGETAYLGFLGAHPRFQHYVDAQENKAARARAQGEAFERLIRGLPPSRVRRFEALRDRCLELRQIAARLQDPAALASVSALDEIQLGDLDRLLWIYLRMHFTQYTLEQFFERTSADQLQAEIRRVEDRLRRLEHEPKSDARPRIRQSLQANLETARSRLDNFEKARDNHAMLQAEIENLETKIQSFTEMAINRGEIGSIAGQVEQIAQGLVRTERSISELGFDTGIEAFGAAVPDILSRAPTSEVRDEVPPPRKREDEIRFI
jgi:hypothetical protein